MKKIINFLACAVLLMCTATLFSCSDGASQDGPRKDTEFTGNTTSSSTSSSTITSGKYSLYLSQTKIYCSSAEQNIALTIAGKYNGSSASWAVSTSSNWMYFSTYSGSGTLDAYIHVYKNSTGSLRTSNLLVTCGTAKQTVTVYQSADTK